jgi:uncharacterized protein (UPF0548 family)
MTLNYGCAGATQVSEPAWSLRPAGFRAIERTVRIGSGGQSWSSASEAIMCWGVKTRSGFDVHSDGKDGLFVRDGQNYTLVARLGPLAISEPVKVVVVVSDLDRCGFAYGTRAGHPVSGEEAFIVSRDRNGDVWLTLRSLTRPSTGGWRRLFPLILVAQRWYHWRYLRSLRNI